MKPGVLVLSLGLGVPSLASAGGLLLPGAGAVSTSRAGTGVASTEGGEAISLNPAGIAKSKGTTITFGAAIINYAMSFQRNGTYDDDPNHAESYEGQRYPLIENTAKPSLGIGPYQPIPLIAVTSDLRGAVPGLSAGFGLYAPNAYPFRNLNQVNGNDYFTPNKGAYAFPLSGGTPPPTRYDTVVQEGAIILPSLAVAYRVMPDLDVGARFSAGIANIKSTAAVWGEPANGVEYINKDSLITVDASDHFVTAWALGAAYRIGPAIELGAQYTAQMNVLAKGDAISTFGSDVTFAGQKAVILPSDTTRCAPGGTPTALKACVEFAIPMQATVGGRYKLLDATGALKGDVELNADWQHWSAERVTDYLIVVDALVAAEAAPDQGLNLKDSVIRHGFRDTYGVRVGGSWSFPMGANAVIARGGIGYETGAAKPGWERVDIDGAARTLLTAGASYKLPKFQIDAGLGFIYEGTRTDSRTCNPMLTDQDPGMPGVQYGGCSPTGFQQPLADRQGPDPITPIVNPDQQLENPVNEGTYKSHYLMFMLGMSTWF